jgi:hypothetical protein
MHHNLDLITVIDENEKPLSRDPDLSHHMRSGVDLVSEAMERKLYSITLLNVEGFD